MTKRKLTPTSEPAPVGWPWTADDLQTWEPADWLGWSADDLQTWEPADWLGWSADDLQRMTKSPTRHQDGLQGR